MSISKPFCPIDAIAPSKFVPHMLRNVTNSENLVILCHNSVMHNTSGLPLPMKHILLADDDNELTELLSEYLSAYEIRCDIADNGRIALEKLQQRDYDLMVLDIMMPELDGLSVLKQLPRVVDIPVIMLTAKGDDIDRIVGLELGADDYLGKPCNPRELLARINAVIKRSQSSPADTTEHLPDSMIDLDLVQRQCHVGDEVLRLTSTEFDLLYLLLQRKGEIVDKETIAMQVLQRELQPFDRSVDVHISRLRKKLSAYHENPIQSLRGKGYQLII